MYDQQKLLIFTRYPEPGATKTRLITSLGPEGAAIFHKDMTELTLKLVEQIKDVNVEIRFEGGAHNLMKDWLGNHYLIKPQGEGDLGKKMDRAFSESFNEGASKAIIIGTDCPGITTNLIIEAYNNLNDHDLVIGPASDGGYYLIGLRKKIPEIFKKIPWGSSAVFQKTFDKAKDLGLRIHLLKTLSDIDRPEDLHLLKTEVRK